MITYRNKNFFLIISMVLHLLNQLQIFWHWYLVELLGLLTGLGLHKPVTLDISRAFNRVWDAGLHHKLKFYGISGQIFGLISSFLSNRWLWVVLDGKSSQEYPVKAGVLQGSILDPVFFYYTLMSFQMMSSVVLLFMLMLLLSTLNVIRHLICGNY